jgi:hypothetical protein
MDAQEHSSRVITRTLESTEFAAWNALVAASPDGSAYALTTYLDALCRATDASFRILGAFLDGELVGGVPLYERASRWGRYVANRTLLYYNGLVLHLPEKKFPSDATAQKLKVIDALATSLDSSGYASIQLHHPTTIDDLRPFQARGWRTELSYSYVIPLVEPAVQWERVDPNLRRLIRRCEREGVVYREDRDFSALFRLHDATRRRKSAPQYLPEDRFAAFFEQLADLGLARLSHAVFDGKVIASQLNLTGPHAVAHTVCAGADAAYLSTGASAFLRWHACLALAASGYRGTDLTDAALNPVTRFKSQLGGQLVASGTVSRTRSVGFMVSTAVRSWRARRAAPRLAAEVRE